MKKLLIPGGLVLMGLAILGLNPFAKAIDAEEALEPGYLTEETGVSRLPDGTYKVSALTRMPKVKAHMVRWWFADFMQTSEHYKWWHPRDHVWMDWENKQPGKIIGASHLVHEYIGGELQKLRIQFVDPTEFFGYDPNDEETFVICARAGMLEEPMNVAKMCHVVRDTEGGAEMRSRFWMGHVATRDGNDTTFSLAGLIGNTALARFILLGQEDARALMTHAIQEMRYLSDFLPALYVSSSS
jgi:hypothetical protein